MEYQRVYDYDFSKHRKVKDWGESKTQPGLAISVKELMKRQIDGRPMPQEVVEPMFIGSENPDEVGFDDYNPLSVGPDKLTALSEMQDQVQTVNEKFARKKAQEIAKAKKEEEKRNEVKNDSDDISAEDKK